MRFRDDIDLDKTWVVSDTHFGHENIVGFCHRPEEHEQVMIAEWRKVVPEDATLLHLGDVCYGASGGNTRFRKLTAKELPPFTHPEADRKSEGRKLLIQGNHDNRGISFYKQSGFKVCKPFQIGVNAFPDGTIYRMDPWNDPEGEQVTPNSRWHVQFDHYPSSEPLSDRVWRVHGHIHNNGYTRDGFVPFLKNHINVSVEQTRYTPVNLRLLLEAVLTGRYPATTDEQMEAARRRREERKR